MSYVCRAYLLNGTELFFPAAYALSGATLSCTSTSVSNFAITLGIRMHDHRALVAFPDPYGLYAHMEYFHAGLQLSQQSSSSMFPL